MFWGMNLKANCKYLHKTSKSFHISNVALDSSSMPSGSGTKNCNQIYLTIDKKRYLLCTLRKEICEQTVIDVNLSEGDEICFHNIGDGEVTLSGYLIEDHVPDESSDDDDMLESDVEAEEDNDVGEAEDLNVQTSKRANKAGKQLQKAKDNSKKAVQAKGKKNALSYNGGKDEEQQEEEDDEDDDDDEDEEEISEEAAKFRAKLMEDMGMSFAEDDSEDDDDDDDDDEEDDNDDEDYDEDEDDDGEQESEEEEEEELPEPKRKQPKQKAAAAAQQMSNGDVSKKAQQQQQQQQQQPAKGSKKAKREKGGGGGEAGANSNSSGPKDRMMSGGVKVTDVRVGDGPEVRPGKRITVYYEGRLMSNNKVFDSVKNGSGFKFIVGRGEVIKGWDIGLMGMKLGGRRRIVCPPGVGYGSRGNLPAVPPNSTLVFDVELKGMS